jgi:hypothetical protein
MADIHYAASPRHGGKAGCASNDARHDEAGADQDMAGEPLEMT